MGHGLQGRTVARSPDNRRLFLGLATAGSIALMVVHICFYTFLCDDAYIQFRYARNLARGVGPVFNPGEHVEGYTSFLWVLQLAVGELLRAPIETFALVLSAIYTGAALVVWALFISRARPGRSRAAVIFITLFALSVNRSWAVWATSGLETRSFTFFILLTFYLLLCAEQADGAGARAAGLAKMSLALALAGLSRPDAQIFLPIIVAWCLYTRHRTVRDVAAMVGPFGILVGAHYLWRHAYYGAWLPNTYYAKVTEPWPDMGARYGASFLLEYGYYLILPFIALQWRRLRPPLTRRLGWLFVVCMAVHGAYYCLRVGGDHFEFRVFDFYAPVILWMAAECLVDLSIRHRIIAGALGLVMLLYSLVIPSSAALNSRNLDVGDPWKEIFATGGQFKVTVENTPLARYLPGMAQIITIHGSLVRHLNRHVIGSRQEIHKLFWQVSKANLLLARGVAEKHVLPPMTIAAGSVGILGYYIDFPIVDVLGLTDATVAHSHVPTVAVVGSSRARLMAHQHLASPDYLEQRHAHVQILSATDHPLPQGQVAQWIAPAGRVNKTYSIRLSERTWLNITSWDPQWVHTYFTETPTEIIPRRLDH